MIEKIIELKLKLGSKDILRKIGKTELGPEHPTNTASSAKRKPVEDAADMG